MTNRIDVGTLREWLEQGEPVIVVDVRSADARAEWSIPGSIHVDAYADLRQGRPGLLATESLPTDRPIVTVCNAGRMSEIAGDALTKRGFDARSLVGGMKAWSLAWNSAIVRLGGTPATVMQLRRTGKGCLSYLVVSNGDAAKVRAALLFRSLQSIRSLGPKTVLLPAHTNQPVAFNGEAIESSVAEADHWLESWLSSESAFVERLLSRLPATPPNFVKIVELNERGEFPVGDVTNLEAGANRCAVS